MSARETAAALDPPLPPVARLQDVSLRYRATRALEAVTLDLPAGRMVGVIGPDGVGKSTLFSLVAGARAIQSGRIEVLGGDMADARHRRRVCPRIAYMPQGLGRNLYATLSVFENVDFFGRLFGHGRLEREQRIAALLQATGLAPFVGRPAGKLSGGMRQKLGLCCALVHDPDLLILDEPTTGVDPLSRRQFWELLDRMRAARPGMSVLVATAYMEEAARFDWLVAMNAGRVLDTGTPREFLARSGVRTLEEAFIALLPPAQRAGHRPVAIPPRAVDAGDGPAIEAHDLTMRFGDFVAVDHVSFRIARGEIFGFLGSNGCGKTTTMKMLTGPAAEEPVGEKSFGGDGELMNVLSISVVFGGTAWMYICCCRRTRGTGCPKATSRCSCSTWWRNSICGDCRSTSAGTGVASAVSPGDDGEAAALRVLHGEARRGRSSRPPTRMWRSACWPPTSTRTTSLAAFRKRIWRRWRGFRPGAAVVSGGGAGDAGPVALDGTKIKANASKHKAMSYDRMSGGGGAEAEDGGLFEQASRWTRPRREVRGGPAGRRIAGGTGAAGKPAGEIRAAKAALEPAETAEAEQAAEGARAKLAAREQRVGSAKGRPAGRCWIPSRRSRPRRRSTTSPILTRASWWTAPPRASPKRTTPKPPWTATRKSSWCAG